MPIDPAQNDLPERGQAVEQRDRSGLGPERELRFSPASEFAIEILEYVRRPQRLPHCFWKIIESKQNEARFIDRSSHGRTKRRPLLHDRVVRGTSGESDVRMT